MRGFVAAASGRESILGASWARQNHGKHKLNERICRCSERSQERSWRELDVSKSKLNERVCRCGKRSRERSWIEFDASKSLKT